MTGTAVAHQLATIAAQPPTAGLVNLRDAIHSRGVALPFAVAFRELDGASVVIGTGDPALEITVRTAAGRRALQSLDELAIAEAYMAGDLDLEGDLVRALELRVLVRDGRILLRAWSVLEPLLLGRLRHNRSAIAKHYDLANVQLLGIDERFNTYTPGIYNTPDEPLEPAAERKLATAFAGLELGSHTRLLDVGCGWGGFLRYCAARSVNATGITLSRDQHQYTRGALEADGLIAEILYQDFFSYKPDDSFDAISLMGVMEDLSDYPTVLERIADWLTPRGHVYLDFAAVGRRFQISSFVAKHVWPGGFRMVHLPQFVSAVDHSPLEIVQICDDRSNYHLWAAKMHDRWTLRHDEVLAVADEHTYRLMRLLFASTAFIMGPRSSRATAYRVLLRKRSAGTRLGQLLPAVNARPRHTTQPALPGVIQRLR